MVTLSATENSFVLNEISSVRSAVIFDNNFFSYRKIILHSNERKQLSRVFLDFKQIEEKKKFSDDEASDDNFSSQEKKSNTINSAMQAMVASSRPHLSQEIMIEQQKENE